MLAWDHRVQRPRAALEGLFGATGYFCSSPAAQADVKEYRFLTIRPVARPADSAANDHNGAGRPAAAPPCVGGKLVFVRMVAPSRGVIPPAVSQATPARWVLTGTILVVKESLAKVAGRRSCRGFPLTHSPCCGERSRKGE